MRIQFYDPDEQGGVPKKKKLRKSPDGGFTLDWVSSLGWSANPFEIEGYPIAGMEDERQKINLFFIKKKRFGIIKGHSGSGKTTLIMWLKKELARYKNIVVRAFNAHQAASANDFRILLADTFRGFLGRGKPISNSDLQDLIHKKQNGRLVLLIDDAHALPAGAVDTINAVLELEATVLLSASEKISGVNASDDLDLILEKRDVSDYMRILKQRIESVGGSGIFPFTKKDVQSMAKKAGNTREFLSLAMDYAIHLSLEKTTAESDVPVSDPKNSVPKSNSGSGKKGKYDDLIESLTEEME